MWKIYPEDNRYEVSDEGLVRMIGKIKPRKPSVTPTGYHVIVVSDGGAKKGFYVHRMVLETFVGKCPQGCCASHLNGVNSDNRLCNLIYENQKSNIARKREHGTLTFGEKHHSAKLTQQDANCIRASKEKGKVLANNYGVSYRTIRRILTNQGYFTA